MTALPFPTADNTVILGSSINFTADGACLVNGGGTAIAEAPKTGRFNKVTTNVSQPISIYTGMVN